MPTRKSSDLLELTGAFRKDPQRRRHDLQGVGELGPPPSNFTPQEIATWDSLLSHVPEGVLTGSDWHAFRDFVGFVAWVEAGPRERLLKHHDALWKFYTRFGMTPEGRRKLAIPAAKPVVNPFEKFGRPT